MECREWLISLPTKLFCIHLYTRNTEVVDFIQILVCCNPLNSFCKQDNCSLWWSLISHSPYLVFQDFLSGSQKSVTIKRHLRPFNYFVKKWRLNSIQLQVRLAYFFHLCYPTWWCDSCHVKSLPLAAALVWEGKSGVWGDSTTFLAPSPMLIMKKPSMFFVVTENMVSQSDHYRHMWLVDFCQ